MKLNQLLLAGAVSLITCGLAQAADFGTDGTMKSFSKESFGGNSLRHHGDFREDRYERRHHRFNDEEEDERERDGDHDDDDHEGVPEPGTWAMLIVGAGMVAYQLRRKQHALGSRAA